MSLSEEQWFKIYDIEDKLLNNYYDEKSKIDIKFLYDLIRSENKQVIDPRTHDAFQKMIDDFCIND